jgi:hypothetical protein
MIAIVACLFVAVASAGSDCSDIKVGSSTWNLGSLPTKYVLLYFIGRAFELFGE